MGFHRRYLNSEQVINVFESSGINGIKSLYTRGVDSLILECKTEGLTLEIDDILSSNKLTTEEKWKHVENVIMENIVIGNNLNRL
tara:strand:- start:1437 stop:1691 length:255 start_codon:yes stop_codon:yes gene_type:complete